MGRIAALLLAASTLVGCGGGTVRATLEAPKPQPPQRLALGIAESNPHLIAPGDAPDGFGHARDALAALHPTYVRVYVDWTQVDGDLARQRDGCMRGQPPCAVYAGVRDQLRAIAARRAREPGRWTPLIVVYGVPDRYALGPSGCERPGTAARSRAINAEGLTAYRALLRELLDAAHAAGLGGVYLSPWNEPNHPAMISPQRAQCTRDAPSLAAATYARLAVAAREVLGARGKLVLGELAAYEDRSPRTSTIAEIVSAIPDDLACSAAAWSVHDYPGRVDGVAALRRALGARACTADVPLWVTETGAGGLRRGSAERRATACDLLARRLARWDADPRIAAVFQYTFRDDPLFPAGLADAGLQRLHASYGLWRGWATLRPRAAVPRCGRT